MHKVLFQLFLFALQLLPFAGMILIVQHFVNYHLVPFSLLGGESFLEKLLDLVKKHT